MIQYRDYKNFSEEKYREFLVNLVSDPDQCPSYDIFLSPFMNKDISQAIMDSPRLRHKFFKESVK